MHAISYYDYHYGRHHTVVGNLQIVPDFYSPQLRNSRDILIYLPPSYYSSNRRYPVLYMQDGQNLFDDAASFAGEWRVDETMETLSQEEGLEGIVVGIANAGAARTDEYSPFRDTRHGGGRGNQYLAFLVHTLKPQIDRHFRTLPDKAQTGILGSSMGGLISLYAFFQRSDVFGFAGVMSPSLWFADDAIFDYVRRSAVYHPGKIYLDAGTREYGGTWPEIFTKRARSRRYYGRVRRLKRILVRMGYRPVHEVLHVEGRGDGHREADWAVRLPNALRYFLGGEIKR